MPLPDRHDCAVAFCCDQKYLHSTLFMIWQIAHLNPDRRFDFVIFSPAEMVLPDWTKPYQIRQYRPERLKDIPKTALFAGSDMTLYRLMLARELGDQYRRILYMDSDMSVEGGDLNRLMEVDLGPYPVAGALDAKYFYEAEFRAREFAKAGLPAAPYMNSGLQLIDTRAYREQEVEKRAFAMMTTYPQAVHLADQSLINLALQGKFARLAPCWNWQLSGRLPLVSARYPIFVRHFITHKKPDRDSSGWLDARFNNAYRDFLTKFMPERLVDLAPPCDPAPMSFRDAAGIVFRHLQSIRLAGDILARHPDPYRPLI